MSCVYLITRLINSYYLSFAEGIESIFSVMFLAEILSCTIQICLQMFLLVTVSYYNFKFFLKKFFTFSIEIIL